LTLNSNHVVISYVHLKIRVVAPVDFEDNQQC